MTAEKQRLLFRLKVEFDGFVVLRDENGVLGAERRDEIILGEVAVGLARLRRGQISLENLNCAKKLKKTSGKWENSGLASLLTRSAPALAGLVAFAHAAASPSCSARLYPFLFCQSTHIDFCQLSLSSLFLPRRSWCHRSFVSCSPPTNHMPKTIHDSVEALIS